MKIKRTIRRAKMIYFIISLTTLILLTILFIRANKGHYLSSLYDLIKLKVLELINLFKAI